MNVNKKKYYSKTSSSIITLLVLEIIFWLSVISAYQYLIINVSEFRLEHPNLIWLLLIVFALNFLWLKNKIWKKNAISKFAKLQTLSKIFNGFSNNRSTIKFILFRLAIGLLIIAAANPQYGENERTVASKGY